MKIHLIMHEFKFILKKADSTLRPFMNSNIPPRKIIHVDMDCFYAAIEIRDNPELANRPVAVGAPPESRGVLCTSNYIARQYGVRSAMSSATAMRLCKNLVLVPINMQKYREVAARIQKIFIQYADLVEPLSLDEAYLDVSTSFHCKGSATLMAEDIRQKIWDTERLTASAGVAPNKFLAKIASGWKKPNGLFVIKPEEVTNFIKTVPTNELFGVGKVTAEKLHQRGLKNCADLQKIPLPELINLFGKLGKTLYEQCRGIDNREVIANRERKSLSVEHTFPQDICDRDTCFAALTILQEKLQSRMFHMGGHFIKNQFIKIKFNNFRQITAESASQTINIETFKKLFLEAYLKVRLPVRLLGIGVHFTDKTHLRYEQLILL